MKKIIVTHISEASRRYCVHLARLNRRTEKWCERHGIAAEAGESGSRRLLVASDGSVSLVSKAVLVTTEQSIVPATVKAAMPVSKA